METYNWLDREIEEQAEQVNLINRICSPYTAAELCEDITEIDELEVKYERV